MKQKTIGMISLMTAMFFAFAATAWAGDFIIQSPAGTNILELDNVTGNLNISTGFIHEAGVRLGTIYWNTTDVATPSDDDTTHISTADQIYDYIAGLSYTANAWNTLDDMVLTDGYIYVGNSSNEPAGVAMSGHATITNAGVVSVVNTAGLSGTNITAGVVAETYIDALIARDTEVVAANTSMSNYVNSMNMTGNVTGTIVDTKFCTYNATNHLINCESEGGTGIDNVVEDTTPQLGGNLDVNDFGIDGGGNTNMTIDATGNFIIVLS